MYLEIPGNVELLQIITTVQGLGRMVSLQTPLIVFMLHAFILKLFYTICVRYYYYYYLYSFNCTTPVVGRLPRLFLPIRLVLCLRTIHMHNKTLNIGCHHMN